MAWKTIVQPDPHKCDPLPNPTGSMLGTILECEYCGARYELKVSYSQRDGDSKGWANILGPRLKPIVDNSTDQTGSR